MNISKYAYSNDKGVVNILCGYLGPEDGFFVEFIDQGVAFDPTKAGKAATNAPLEERKIGGLGIYIARTLSSDMSYKRLDNKNILKLLFK